MATGVAKPKAHGQEMTNTLIATDKLNSNVCPSIIHTVNVRIEIDEVETIETASKKYVASLYIDNEKVDESIELDFVPKVNVVGKTFIGNEERFFEGYIKNAKIYKEEYVAGK